MLTEATDKTGGQTNRPTSVHGFTDDALGSHDGTALAAMVRAGDVTSSELVAAAIARALAVEPSLCAIAERRFDDSSGLRLRSNDAIASSGAAFAGVPTFIKDMTDVAGMVSGYGSAAFARAKPARRTDPLAQQLFDMGLVCIGKSTMPELGLMPTTEYPDRPPTRNPWNTSHTAGGSSGGSAALVAAGVVPIAHASDGGGSTRIPAACCGLVGLKATRGRLIPTKHTKTQIVGLTVEGVVTRSVRDTAAFYAEADKRFRNKRLPPIGQVARPLSRPLRVGVINTSPGSAKIDAETQRVLDETAGLLETLDHRVTPASAPVTDQFREDFITYWSFLGFALVRLGSRVIAPSFRRSGLTDFTEGLAAHFGKRWRHAPAAVRRLRQSAKTYATLFETHDVILSPTLAHVTPEIGYLAMDLPFDVVFPRACDWTSFTPYANANGAPSISLPLGHNSDANLPIGMMFGANHGQETLLLELALQLEEASPWKSLEMPPAVSRPHA